MDTGHLQGAPQYHPLTGDPLCSTGVIPRPWRDAVFLQELTPPQQQAFLSIAVRLVATDGQVGESELELLSRMALQVGIAPGWRPDSDSPLSSLLRAFD